MYCHGDGDVGPPGDLSGAGEQVVGVEADRLVGLDGERCGEVGKEGDVEDGLLLFLEHEQVGGERVEGVAVAVHEGDDDGQCPLVDAQDLTDLVVRDLDR